MFHAGVPIEKREEESYKTNEGGLKRRQACLESGHSEIAEGKGSNAFAPTRGGRDHVRKTLAWGWEKESRVEGFKLAATYEYSLYCSAQTHCFYFSPPQTCTRGLLARVKELEKSLGRYESYSSAIAWLICGV